MSLADKQVVIVHGTGGDPTENWFPWLAQGLRDQGARVLVPQFPTPEGQSFDSWRETLNSMDPKVDDDLILVGHSIGCAFILRLLETSGPVAGCVMASGFVGQIGNDEFDPLNAPFFADPLDWTQIRANMGDTRVFFGDDDPYVPIEAAELLSEGLRCPLEKVPGGGHLNAAAGFTTFPAVFEAVEEIGSANESST